MTRACTWVAAALVLAAPSAAAADDLPVLLVVESAPGDAAEIRRAVGALLPVPVVALGDARAPSSVATVSVALSADRRRAWLLYRDDRTARFGELRAPATDAASMRWIADGVARLVEESVAHAGSFHLVDGVIDPFEGRPRPPGASLELPTEVVDPWSEPGPISGRALPPRESGSRLGRPSPSAPQPRR